MMGKGIDAEAGGNFHNLEMDKPVNGHAHSASAPSGGNAREPPRLGWPATIWLGLASILALIAFILGCYSTQQVRTLKYPPAYLVSQPGYIPAGYSVFPLGSGLGYWAKERDMLHGRSDHGVIGYQGKAYLLGGYSNTDSAAPLVLNSTVRYDPFTGFAEELDPMPEPRYRFAYALLGEMMYVIGGSSEPNGSIAGPTNTAFAFNATSGKWRRIANINTPRIDVCGGAVNGKVYVLGGYDETFTSLHTVEEYDPATDVWTALPASSNLNVGRGDCRATDVDGKLYAVGGVESFQPAGVDCGADWIKCYRFLASVEMFDPATRKWTLRAPMLQPRGDFAIDALPGGRILVAGGEFGNGTVNQLAGYTVEEYYAPDDVWTEKAPLPEARFRADAAALWGRVYIFGGAPTCGIAPAGGNATAAECYNLALKSVYGYFDIQHPHLYAYYKPAPEVSEL